MSGDRKIRIWRGLNTICVTALTFSLVVTSAVSGFRTDINKFLGTKSTEFVADKSVDPAKTYTYKSDYKSTKELLLATRDLGERVSEEGSVLLKNQNASLPLSKDEIKKVSLLGFSSYFPVQGGDMGSSLAENKGTDADTLDLLGAFRERGFEVNPVLEKIYQSMKDKFTTEINNFGMISHVTRMTAPMIGQPFTAKEPSQADLDQANSNWKDSLKNNNIMIITLARSAGENRDYTPGKAGVDPKQAGLHQTDPLGLSDNERALIDTAIQAKEANGGKVIVLTNSASALQIQEVQNNAGVDAIMHVGLPGGYGFLGVADLLKGAANPSGRLSDTWVVNNQSTPAAINYGDYEWKNADAKHLINSELVEAEGIYTGYKYYETRYADAVLGQGDASSAIGSSNGGVWDYNQEVTYPFGYGLSYSSFNQQLEDVQVNLKDKSIQAKVRVTNTGSTAGKDVVQLYASTPYTDYDKRHQVEKAAVQLLDYSKTRELKPGESQELEINADAQYLASWDSTSSNEAGTKGNYILDAGTYTFAIGEDAHKASANVLASQGHQEANGDAGQTSLWKLDSLDKTTFAKTKNGTKVQNRLSDGDLNHWMPKTVTYLSRSDWSGTWPKTYKNLTATDKMLKAGLTNESVQIVPNGEPSSVTWEANSDMTLAQLKGVSDIKDHRWSKLINQLKLSEAMIRIGFGGTSTKPIASISSPEVIQNDGPNGFGSYPLGQYANKDKSSGDPYTVDEHDPNLKFNMAVMATEPIIGQTFSKQIAEDWGKLLGNYSIWANTTILWGVGVNLHRVAYNARNHEYYSEDPMLTSYQASSSIAAARKYGCILGPKHFTINDTEINRMGLATFATEQKIREGELRAQQASVEDAGALGMMTAFNRFGPLAVNAHKGLLQNILREEWGFKGLLSEDFIMDPGYQNIRAGALYGVTMLTSTGEDNVKAVAKRWPYWNEKSVKQDVSLQKALKKDMLWQNYALANSNAMDGLNKSSRLRQVRTWYDKVLSAVSLVSGLLTLLTAVMYIVNRHKTATENRSGQESAQTL